MNIKNVMKDIFAAIRVPRSKIELAECLGLNMEELTLLLDYHCPEGHIIHENDGHVQVIPFDSDLCGYISPEGKQCQTRPKHSRLYCARHYPQNALSPEMRLFSLYISKWGFPLLNGQWNWPQSKEAHTVKAIVVSFSPVTNVDRSFISLVARLQKKAAKGELTRADEEELLSMIKRPYRVKPSRGYG